jgi:hypothetical protein
MRDLMCDDKLPVCSQDTDSWQQGSQSREHMAEKIIFTQLDEDYFDDFPLADLLRVVAEVEQRALDYDANLHLGEVSSSAPYAYLAYHAPHGFLLTVRIAQRCFVAGRSFAWTRLVRFRAGEHILEVPEGLFLPAADVQECLREFCELQTLSESVSWQPYDELGYELFGDSD